MKNMKKIFALLIAMVLVLSLSTSAFAATITITNTQPTTDENATIETYTAYKIFSAVLAEGTTISTNGTAQTASGAISYEISSTDEWFSTLFNEDGTAKDGQTWLVATELTGKSTETVKVYQVAPSSTMIDEDDAIECANWLLAHKPESATPIPLNEGPNQVDDGYYLVTSSLGTNLGLATAEFPMDIVEKNVFPSINKKQNDVSATAEYTDSAVDVAVNDTIYYEIVVYVPATADTTKNLAVTDILSEGLTFTYTAGSSFSVNAGNTETEFPNALTENTDWEVSGTPTANSFVINIKPTTQTLGKYVAIRFSAVANEKAIATDTLKMNSADLVYSNYKQTDFVEYETNAAGAIKVDGQDHTSTLAGAKFKLQLNGADLALVKVTDADNGDYYRPALSTEAANAVEIETLADGKIQIRGLDNDSAKHYTLVETKAPDGYNLLTTPTKLTVVDNNTTAEGKPLAAIDVNTLKIENNQGSILPSTGGIGTTIFYIIGAILVIGAGVVIVTKRRMNNDQ